MHSSVKIDSTSKIVSVCMSCHPGNSIFAVRPELSGYRVSHGICPEHKAAFLAELKKGK